MLRHLLLVIFTATLAFTAQAQQTEPSTLPDFRLPYVDPLDIPVSQRTSSFLSTFSGSDDNELLPDITQIYRIYIRALEALSDDDLVAAEQYITRALASIQRLADEYPEAQSSRRMAELYRTVMIEYHIFYGITDPIPASEGEIFAVLEEMFNLEDDLFESDRFVIPGDIDLRRTEVPLILNTQVHNQINFLVNRRPEIMERWLERSAIYFPMMRQIFEEEGVPEELIHLSMIESGLVPTARSHARAVGLWQFIYATGAHYGLEANWWIDERRDPEKSTRAAARHLRDLYNTWGDWHLALAGYNVSPRRIRSSIQRAGGVRDYWAIFPYLPRETRGYVPGYIAATIVAMNPKEFGFDPKLDAAPWAYDLVPVQGSVDLNTLAEFAGITTQELRNLNPELLRWATPPGRTPYQLKIPVGTKEKFLENYKTLPESARRQVVVHTVSRGENLGIIANRYNVTVRDLYAVNERLSTTIFPGQEIVIPVPQGSNVAIAANTPSRARTAATSSSSTAATAPTQNTPANSARLTYTVKSGDTIGHIAEWYGTQAWRIRNWNNIGNTIRVGQRLTIFVPANQLAMYQNVNAMTFAEKQAFVRDRRAGRVTPATVATTGSAATGADTYTVRPNDNLWDIARANNTTVDRIKQLNNLTSNRIVVGQVLRLR
ncbi:MAG: LysM peptidoglycan-binding domain-containing protein [Bacteroidetes bacterium]|nr:LysM peptidoglycan-binding domain-containing protein [Bacteroidota bacterium]